MAESFGLWDRICMGLGRLSGPVELAMVWHDVVPSSWQTTATLSVVLWVIWIGIVFASGLRKLHYALHITAAFLWGAAGACAAFLETLYA